MTFNDHGLSSIDENIHHFHHDNKRSSNRLTVIRPMFRIPEERPINQPSQKQKQQQSLVRQTSGSLIHTFSQNRIIRTLTMKIAFFYFLCYVLKENAFTLLPLHTKIRCYAKPSQFQMQSMRVRKGSMLQGKRPSISRRGSSSSSNSLDSRNRILLFHSQNMYMMFRMRMRRKNKWKSMTTTSPTTSKVISSAPSKQPSSYPVRTTLSPAYSTMPISSSPSSNSITYIPGLLTTVEEGLTLSEGLTARLIATSGNTIPYIDGNRSSIDIFLDQPDAAATYIDTRPWNIGGWVYTINFEIRPRKDEKNKNQGGVGSITFNANGDIIHYETILKNQTFANCGGGKTPWNVSQDQ
jgi:hypothetical protein